MDVPEISSREINMFKYQTAPCSELQLLEIIENMQYTNPRDEPTCSKYQSGRRLQQVPKGPRVANV